MPRLYGQCVSAGPARDETPDLPLSSVKYVPIVRPPGTVFKASSRGDSNTRRRARDVTEAVARLADLGYAWRDAQAWGRTVRAACGRRRWTEADLATSNVVAINAFVDHVLAEAAKEKAS